MLYKPATASPHAETIDPADQNGILFNCQILSSSNISKTRLMINDGAYEYYFPNDVTNPKIAQNDYGVNIDCIYLNSINTAYAIKLSDSRRYEN